MNVEQTNHAAVAANGWQDFAVDNRLHSFLDHFDWRNAFAQFWIDRFESCRNVLANRDSDLFGNDLLRLRCSFRDGQQLIRDQYTGDTGDHKQPLGQRRTHRRFLASEEIGLIGIDWPIDGETAHHRNRERFEGDLDVGGQFVRPARMAIINFRVKTCRARRIANRTKPTHIPCKLSG